MDIGVLSSSKLVFPKKNEYSSPCLKEKQDSITIWEYHFSKATWWDFRPRPWISWKLQSEAVN
jgi:hypothetical protein